MTPELSMINGHPVLRLQRVLNHPPERVWRAITDPQQLSEWFPARVELATAAPGSAMTFHFDGGEPGETPDEGEVLEADEPKVFAFRWNTDVIRCELLPHERGCLLVFTHTLRGPDSDRPSAARHGAGWLICLDALNAGLEGTSTEFDMAVWFARAEEVVELFGLGEGQVLAGREDWTIRFERDLVQPPHQVWELLSGGEVLAPGDQAPLPATHGYGDAGAIVEAEPARALAYAWADGGQVRFELREQHPIGTRLVLTHTVTDPHPRASLLAAWHTHLELLFAALHGDIRCPWPAERTEALRSHYAAALG